MPEEDHVVAIGRKDIMSYVIACLTCLHDKNGYFIVKARGSYISKAVEVVMTVKNKFVKELNITDVRIGTEHLPSPDGKLIAKSWIMIRGELPRRRR